MNYSDPNTPGVTYIYDTADATNRPAGCVVAGGEGPIGRLAAVANSISANYYYYDKLGYTECNRQKTGGTPYDFTYSRSPQGEPEQTVYPVTGRTVTATIDNAGRIAKLCGATCYAGDASVPINYAAHGAVSQVKLGNGLYETSSFNGRLQLTDRKLGTSPGDASVWRLQNGFSATQNNGNVLSQTETVAGWSSPVTTQYRYDNLNRLAIANENPSNPATPACPDAASRWCEGFSYDERGNMLVTALEGPVMQVNQPAGFNGANQVTGTNWHYDAKGNMDQMPAVGGAATFLNNGENLQLAYCPNDTAPANCAYNTNSGRTIYGYDGQGRRVSRSDATGSTTFVYDADGRLAAEYGGTVSTPGTRYVTDDQLGSTRVVTDATQNIVTRRDYLPFGDEIVGTTRSGRNGIAGYATDGGVTLKFTSKKRDAETGLDYFGARYFSGAQGRFTSPDSNQFTIAPCSFHKSGTNTRMFKIIRSNS